MKPLIKLTQGNLSAATQPVALDWSPDSQQLAVNHPDNAVSIYQVKPDERILESSPRLVLQTGLSTGLRWVDADHLLVMDEAKLNSIQITKWDTLTGQVIDTQTLDHTPLQAWNRDFTKGIKAEDGRLFFGDKIIEASHPNIGYLELNDDGSKAMVIYVDPTNHTYLKMLKEMPTLERHWALKYVEIWDVVQGRLILSAETGKKILTELSFSPDGQHYTLRAFYLKGDGEADIREDFIIYEASTGQNIFRDWRFQSGVAILPTWSTDSQQVLYWLWSPTLNQTPKSGIGIFDIASRQQKVFYNAGFSKIFPLALAWCPAKDLLAIADTQHIIHLYAVDAMDKLFPIKS